MFSWLEYIECQEDDLIEIVNTLTPIHKEMKYFIGHYITKKAEKGRLSMFSWLEYIECQEDDLIEIVNTLTPIHKEMKYFRHYIIGKERYIKLTVASQIRKA